MTTLAVGLSHRSAPLSVLERAAVAAADPGLVGRLLASDHLSDAVVLATCNRVEVYAETSRFHGGVGDVVRALADGGDVHVDDLMPHLYVHYDAAVADHLFTVASGLDSMAIGESQILAQVRSTWQLAGDEGRLGRLLDELLQRALRTGKRAQTETGLDRMSNALVEHALDRAEAVLDGPASTVVVGAGAMAAVVVSSLVRRGALDRGRVSVVNRSTAAAERLAAAYPGTSWAPWSNLAPTVAEAGLVVTCTGAVGHVVDARSVAERGDRPRPQVFVDLALPRDVDPLVSQAEEVVLLDLELLGGELTADTGRRDIDAARRIVAEEVAAWQAHRASTGVAPTVVALRDRALAVIDAELDRLDRRLPDLSEHSRTEIRNTVRRVVEKVIHTPTVRVKELADGPEGSFYAEALRTLFDLDVSDSTAASDVERALAEVTR